METQLAIALYDRTGEGAQTLPMNLYMEMSILSIHMVARLVAIDGALVNSGSFEYKPVTRYFRYFLATVHQVRQ